MPAPFHPLLAEQLLVLGIEQEKVQDLFPVLEKINALYQEKEELNKELEKTNKELDQFVYSISHDLRAPISSLLGLLNLAELEEDKEALTQYMGLMRNSIVKMDHFVHNLISYSQTNRLENVPEPVDFKSLVGEICSNLRHLPNAFDIDFIQQYEEDFPFHTDIHKLKIILTNLLSNAIQYHRPKQEKPFILLSVKSNKKETIIQVQDNGQGIEEEYHSKVFNMFFRGNATSTGNGLGLYITRETCRKLGARLSFISAPSTGTTFTLVFPNMAPAKEEKPAIKDAE